MSPDLSRAAGACPVVVAAVRLAEWIGEDGVPVTPGGSLRPADVPTASAALGILTRAKVRRAADVPEVHRPWLTAIAAGLIIITDGRAVRADRLEDPLAAWWTGLQALLAAEAADTIGVDPRITATVTMDVVTGEHLHDSWDLQHRVGRLMYDRGDWDILAAPQRHGRVHPAEAALTLLRLFGAIEGTRLTPLGTWGQAELRKMVPAQITPDLPAADLLARLAGTDEVDAWNRACRWFGDRTRNRSWRNSSRPLPRHPPPNGSGRHTDQRPGRRGGRRVACHRTDARQPGRTHPPPGTPARTGTHARHRRPGLAGHRVRPRRPRPPRRRRSTRHRHGRPPPCRIDLDTGGIDRIASSGHPHAAAVAEALAAVAGTAVPVQQLRISLSGQCWRRVLIAENATLETLHHVIIALFGWDDDHLHIFTVGRHHYADSFHGLEETVPEHTMRLHQALPHPKATKVLPERPLPQPEFVTGKGDNPIEYYDPDAPEEPVPFDTEAINKRLHKLAAT